MAEQVRTITEEIEIAGEKLVEKVKALLEEGNVRQIRVRASEGDVYFETPLTIGLIAGGILVLAAPMLAVLRAIAASVSKVRIEVVRDESPSPAPAASEEPGDPDGTIR